MRKFLSLVGALCLFLAASQSARAAMSVQDYEDLKNDAERSESTRLILDTYFAGLIDGLTSFNLAVSADMYCVPDNIALSVGLMQSIVNDAISTDPAADHRSDRQIAALAMKGLTQAFPCSK